MTSTLDRMKDALGKATPGPWVARRGVHYWYIEEADGSDVAKVNTSPLGIHEQRSYDATFIALARSGVEELIAENEHLQKMTRDRLEDYQRACVLLTKTEAENQALRARLEAAEKGSEERRVALEQAANQFRYYENQHASKGTKDGDMKAITNKGMAIICENAIQLTAYKAKV